MIGKLKGIIDCYGDDWVIVDVGGVGYQVYCSSRTLQALPQPGEAAALSIETYVREDMIRLYGFGTDAEREWFRLLMTVQGVGAKVALGVLGVLKPGELASAIALQDKAQIARAPGVGPKVALAVLGTLKPGDLSSAIALQDKAALARAPGVGKKVAERIVAELRDKAPGLAGADPAVVHLQADLADKRAPRPVADAVSALVNLGYQQLQASAAVAAAQRNLGEGATTEQLIRQGLKELAR